MLKFLFGLIVGSIVMLNSYAPASAVELFPDKSIKMLYINSCGECHGRRGKGGGDAPSLRNNEYIKISDQKVIKDIILKGVPKKETRYPGKYEDGMPETKGIAEEDAKKLTDMLRNWSK